MKRLGRIGIFSRSIYVFLVNLKRQRPEIFETIDKEVRRSRTKVKAVAKDMSPAYISAVLQHLPVATIVFDHFHATKLFNDKLSDLRRDLFRETKENLHKEVLKVGWTMDHICYMLLFTAWS
jgi:hypothetical protein